MPRDINDVVVVGYGSWSDVNALPTLGFGIGVAVAAAPAPLHWTIPQQSGHYTIPLQSGHFTIRSDGARS